MEFNLDMLVTITKNFSEDHKVGSGGYGDVYRAVYAGKEIAVKRFHRLQGLHEKDFENECRNLSKVHHENVVELLGYCRESRKEIVEYDGRRFFATSMEQIFCFEYMQGGDLEKHIKDDSCDLDWPTCYKIIKGTSEGINHLHTAYQKPIFHLGIKPSNILLDNNKNAKIADFAFSRLALRSRSLVEENVKGTLVHVPPEFQINGCITVKYDVFSLGVLIIKLMDGHMGPSRCIEMGTEHFIEHVYRNWNKRLKEIPGHPSHEIESLQVKKCVEIALRCVLRDRNKRPSTKDVVDELKQLDQHLSSSSGLAQLDVVIVYAFDCSYSTSAWYTVDDGVFWMVQEKLTHYQGSRMGYIYPMVDGNTCKSDMKLVDPEETIATGYTAFFSRRRVACTKNMASGLDKAHKMISNGGYQNSGVILLFSDGLINKGDFFDGAEEFISKVPVHVFTLGGAEYNQGLHAIAMNSPGGKFHTIPVPERPMLSARFSLLLDSIFDSISLSARFSLLTFKDEDLPSPSSENQPLDVVLVYAFDCTEATMAWYKMNGAIFWMVQKKLTRLENSCMGFIYPMLTENNYTSDMKIVDSSNTKATGYRTFARRRISCTKNMASGLVEAHKMLSNRGYRNGIILFFSDGLINKGDFFDGTEYFRSKVPVHTFTLGGDAYNHGLYAIAENSPGGTFNPVPVPDRPDLSAPFSELLDSLLIRGSKAN